MLNSDVVDGQEVDSKKYDHKLHWLDKVTDHIDEQLQRHERIPAAPAPQTMNPEGWKDPSITPPVITELSS